jgi:DNA-directed RNA polymerase subunit RPC12/RpoP
MKAMIVIIGLGLILLGLGTFAASSGAFFAYGLVIFGCILLASGLIGERSFKCVSCRRNFTTKDSQQGKYITCPQCGERYMLKDNTIICLRVLEDQMAREQQRMCPNCRTFMRPDIMKETWYCTHCRYTGKA